MMLLLVFGGRRKPTVSSLDAMCPTICLYVCVRMYVRVYVYVCVYVCLRVQCIRILAISTLASPIQVLVSSTATSTTTFQCMWALVACLWHAISQRSPYPCVLCVCVCVCVCDAF